MTWKRLPPEIRQQHQHIVRKMANDQLPMVSWNCRALKNNCNEIKLIISKYNPAAICLQESYLKESDAATMRGYTAYHSYVVEDNGKAMGGM